jgi:hypothetical protein
MLLQRHQLPAHQLLQATHEVVAEVDTAATMELSVIAMQAEPATKASQLMRVANKIVLLELKVPTVDVVVVDADVETLTDTVVALEANLRSKPTTDGVLQKAVLSSLMRSLERPLLRQMRLRP